MTSPLLTVFFKRTFMVGQVAVSMSVNPRALSQFFHLLGWILPSPSSLPPFHFRSCPFYQELLASTQRPRWTYKEVTYKSVNLKRLEDGINWQKAGCRALQEQRWIHGLSSRICPEVIEWWCASDPVEVSSEKIHRVVLKMTFVFFEIRAIPASGQMTILCSRFAGGIPHYQRHLQRGLGGRRPEAHSLEIAPGHSWGKDSKCLVWAEWEVGEERTARKELWKSRGTWGRRKQARKA